jgi:hypothetical protein
MNAPTLITILLQTLTIDSRPVAADEPTQVTFRRQ